MTPNRMFNPRTGRWSQPDPLFWGPRNIQGSRNVMAQAGNLYMFVMHNPVRWVDPTGLSAAIPMAMLGTGGIFGPVGPSILRPPSGIGVIGNPGLAGGFATVGFGPVAFENEMGSPIRSTPATAAANRIAGSSASSALSGVSILIDPGHGNGIDRGTHGYLNGRRIYESHMNMNVSLYLRSILQAMGANVSMTHGVHSTQSAVAARYRNVQYGNPNLVISVHFNGHENQGAHGIEVLHRRNCSASVHLATSVFNSLAEQTSLSGTSRYTPIYPFGHPVLNNSQVPAILVEPGFMTNAADMYFIYHNQFSIAEAIAHGIFNSR